MTFYFDHNKSVGQSVSGIGGENVLKLSVDIIFVGGGHTQVHNAIAQPRYKDQVAEISIPGHKNPVLGRSGQQQIGISCPGLAKLGCGDDIMPK